MVCQVNPPLKNGRRRRNRLVQRREYSLREYSLPCYFRGQIVYIELKIIIWFCVCHGGKRRCLGEFFLFCFSSVSCLLRSCKTMLLQGLVAEGHPEAAGRGPTLHRGRPQLPVPHSHPAGQKRRPHNPVSPFRNSPTSNLRVALCGDWAEGSWVEY